MTMRGTWLSPECSLIRLAVSIPSIPGIFQSMTTIPKGLSLSAFSTSAIASCPVAARTILNDNDSSMSRKISLEVGLSSTTRTFRPRRFGAGLNRFLTFSRPRPKTAVKLKVLPRPGSLSTQISPSIMFASFLLMASPRPVPPYLRVVEVSAWVND